MYCNLFTLICLKIKNLSKYFLIQVHLHDVSESTMDYLLKHFYEVWDELYFEDRNEAKYIYAALKTLEMISDPSQLRICVEDSDSEDDEIDFEDDSMELNSIPGINNLTSITAITPTDTTATQQQCMANVASSPKSFDSEKNPNPMK